MTHSEQPADYLNDNVQNDNVDNNNNDVYRFGRRNIVAQNESANITHEIRPLKREDFLNPQPDDEFNHGPEHARLIAYLAARLRHHFRYTSQAAIVEGAKLCWADPALDRPIADLIVLNYAGDNATSTPDQLYQIDLQQPRDAKQAAGDASPSQTVRAIFEVTSPLFAELDLTAKRDLYAAAGVPEYWIIDTGLRPDEPTLRIRILGYQLQEGQYVTIAPQPDGRLVSPVCRLWFSVTEDGTSFTVGDLRTGEVITPSEEAADTPSHAKTEANLRARSIADQLNL